jgi:hypothetical protein
MITWIVNVLQNGQSQDKIEALKMLARLRILTRKILDAFLLTLRDFHVTVRLEACKTSCVLASNHPGIINALIELADDFVPKIRAYAMKGKG